MIFRRVDGLSRAWILRWQSPSASRDNRSALMGVLELEDGALSGAAVAKAAFWRGRQRRVLTDYVGHNSL
jgi:hypothetical protein